MKPRILLAISTLSNGGAELVMSLLGNWLYSRGHDVALTTFRTEENEWHLDKRIPRYDIDAYKKAGEEGEAGAVAGLKRIIAAYKPTHTISLMGRMNLRCIAACKNTGVKNIVRDCAFPPVGYPADLVKECEQHYPDVAALVTLTSRCITDWASGFMPQEKLHIITNPYLAHTGVPTPPPCDNYILSVGRLNFQKAYPDLLQAFKMFSAKHPDVNLVITGQGEEEQKLHELSQQMGIDAKVIFTGFCPNPSLLYENALFYASASHFEGYPCVLVEAMWHGCPAIYTDCISGPRELLGESERGMLVPVGDIEALSNAMTTMYEQPELRARYAQKAKEYTADFTEDRVFGKWVELIHSLQ